MFKTKRLPQWLHLNSYQKGNNRYRWYKKGRKWIFPLDPNKRQWLLSEFLWALNANFSVSSSMINVYYSLVKDSSMQELETSLWKIKDFPVLAVPLVLSTGIPKQYIVGCRFLCLKGQIINTLQSSLKKYKVEVEMEPILLMNKCTLNQGKTLYIYMLALQML